MGKKSAQGTILILLILIVLQFQNCTNPNVVFFSTDRASLSSRVSGGDIYDGKPSNGAYCRVFDSMACPANIKNLQGLVNVDDSKIHLMEDNCTSTAMSFLDSDVAVNFTSLASEYIGITRGIFKKCEVDANSLPLPLTEMPEAYCTTSANNVAVVINKNLTTQKLDLTLTLTSNGQIRMVKSDLLNKVQDSGGTTYSSSSNEFDLNITNSKSQTLKGTLTANIDDSPINISMECRQANINPTVIIEQDMEISPTWIDTTNLAGYWKLNETSAIEGTQIQDSSRFKFNLNLFTGSDGLNKRNSSVKGGALDFDGNDNLNRASPTDGHLDFDTRSFSYMTWMKKDSHAGQWDMLIWKGGNCQNCEGYEMQCGTSGCAASISDGDGSPIGQSIVSVNFAQDGSSFFGRWVHLAVVVDRSTQTLRSYVNGALVDTKDISAVGSITNTQNFHIGSGMNGSWGFLGSLDDVAVWNEALSEADIKMIFERLRPKFY